MRWQHAISMGAAASSQGAKQATYLLQDGTSYVYPLISFQLYCFNSRHQYPLS